MELKQKSYQISGQENAVDSIDPSVKTCQRRLLFKDFRENVTMHGFRFLFEGSLLRRFIWFLITSTITAFVVILFYNLLFDYLEHKTVTNYDIEYVDRLDFPTVSICPLNTVSNRKLQNLRGNLTTGDIRN